MKWFLIESGETSGIFNMKFDFELARICKNDEAFFRLYRWNPYCISLGANQKFDDIDINKANNDGIDIVKRPTGGRAILHAEEITYSVVLPFHNIKSVKGVYQKISLALIKGLKLYHPIFNNLELENLQSNFHNILNTPNGLLCFGSTAKNEVKFNGRKIIGSAQRKLNTSLLQHGSILCGNYHRNLVKYLNIDEKDKLILQQNINEKTIEIETILNEKTDYSKLSRCLIEGFEKEWNIKFEDFNDSIISQIITPKIFPS